MKKALILFFLLFLMAPAAFSAPQEGDLLLIFEELDLSGHGKENVEALEAYIRRNPGGESVDEALLRLGRIYTDRKDLSKAAEAFLTLVGDFPESRFRYEALFELGSLRFRSGRLDEAKAAFERLSSDRGAGVGLRAKAGRMLKSIEAASSGIPAMEGPAIGALLPLKGSYASFGEDALNGVLLAADVFGGKGPSAGVIVKNVGADAASVESAFKELSEDGRVAGIVGPLLSATVFDAARQAQRHRIPVITLSQKEGVTDAGDFVFRNFVTPADQAKALAGYSVKNLGKKRFAVVYPQNNYGVELSKLFEMEVKEAGGSVVRQASYAQGKTDFSDEIRRIFGVQTKERMEGRRKIKEFTPTVSIDALFIPDSYESAALIAPYLEYYGIKGVQLLGPNGWNSQKLIEAGGKNVEGAVFVDGFFSGSKRASTEEFSRRFKETYGRAPGVLEAQAYDSARMLLAAIREAGSTERDAVRESLKDMKGFHGASGEVSFDSRREAVKELFILTVRDGRIVEAR